MRAVVQHNGESATVLHVLCVPYSGNMQITVGTKEKWPDTRVVTTSGNPCSVTVLFPAPNGGVTHTRVDIYPTTPEECKLINDGYIHDNISARYGRTLVLFLKPDNALHDQIILWESCDNCDGDGMRVPANPSCHIDVPPGYVVLERCDTCQLFADDMAAAKSAFSRITEVACWDTGSPHICVDPSSRLGGPAATVSRA